MPLDPPHRGLLRNIYKNFRDAPLQPENPFYEPLYQELQLDDPVDRIATAIDFDGAQSIRLFSGFRGSGKTTELLRLKRRLEEQGYVVLYSDALDYVNASEPIDITDLLMVLAGAFSEQTEALLGVDMAYESYWERLWKFLQTQVVLTGGSVRAEAKTPAEEVIGGLKAGVDLKFELKSSPDFKRSLQHVMTNRTRELKQNVDAFIEGGVRRIRKARGENVEIVFIFDQLEQIRGSQLTEQEVISSIRRTFSGSNLDLLSLPYVHAVYTVPPWLRFVLAGPVEMTLLSVVHLWNNDPDRTRCEPAWRVFRSLIDRRIDPDSRLRLLGPEDQQGQLLDRIIAMCGGQFRDLLRLMADTVRRADSAGSLPVTPAIVESAIHYAQRDFGVIPKADAKWLDEIGRLRATALPDTEPASVSRLTQFIDTHFVLNFVNATDWYDIHPMIRGEVEAVVKAIAAEQAAAPIQVPTLV